MTGGGDGRRYRVVNVGATRGTMARLPRADEGGAGAFPFLDGCKANIRPDRSTVKVIPRRALRRGGAALC